MQDPDFSEIMARYEHTKKLDEFTADISQKLYELIKFFDSNKEMIDDPLTSGGHKIIYSVLYDTLVKIHDTFF